MANQNNQQLNAWQEAQSRVIDLFKNASPEDMTNRVPACPEWTAHDLLAHMVGVSADLISEAGPPVTSITGRKATSTSATNCHRPKSSTNGKN